MDFDLEYIEKLAQIISENGLTEISLEDEDQAITIRKDLPEVVVGAAPTVAAAPAPAVQAAADTVKPSEAKEEPKIKGKAITSPMVGTFYIASSPDAAPFVEVGSTISEGDVVCIIEAMKLMNEIESEYAGVLKKVLVSDGQMVEYGQALFEIE